MLIQVILWRVSTDDQHSKGYSVPEQIRACRELAATLAGGQPATVLEFGDDMSGEHYERPGLQAALEVCRAQNVAQFICLDPDRMARKLAVQLMITDAIEKTGCRLHFVQHDYQNTPEGQLFYAVRGAVSEFEKTKIAERFRRGYRGKLAAGGIPHNLRLYGYDYIIGAGRVTADQVLIPKEDEAKWIKSIYQWCIDEGYGPQAIANRLNTLGVKTKLGKKWTHGQARRVLVNETYHTGVLNLNTQDHKGIYVNRQLTKEDRKKRRIKLTPITRSKDQWSRVTITPIVSQEVYDLAQAVLAGFKTGERGVKSKWRMLTSLGVCGVCGAPLYYMNGTKIVCSGRYLHYYKPTAERSTCTLPAKPYKAVEDAVWRVVRSWILNPALLKEGVRAHDAKNNGGQPDRLTALNTELASIEQSIAEKDESQARIGELYSRKLWPAEKVFPALEQLRNEITELEKRRTTLQVEVQNINPTRAPSPAMELLDNPDLLQEAQEGIDDAPEHKRIEWVRLFAGRYVLRPSGRGETPDVQVFPR